MADIALLVAEEFERRRNRNRMEKEEGKEEEAVELNCTATYSLLSKGGEELSKEMEELVRRVMEPKSTFGLAAFDGFFSA